MTNTTLLRSTLACATTLAAALALTGCSLLGGGADRDEESGQVTSTAEDSVFSMKVGDCLNEPEGTEVSDVVLVPCSEAHDYEVFAEKTLPDGDYPTDLDAQAEEFCVAEFQNFIGLDYNSSSIELTWFTPTQGSWDQQNDRLIQCIVTDPAGPTTGSLKDANK